MRNQEFRIIVCGGRNYNNREHVFSTLDRIHSQRAITMVIEGWQTGADALAWEWAVQRKVEVRSIKADWDKMLMEGRPIAVYAFPGGNGTANMLQQAYDAGIAVRTPGWNWIPELKSMLRKPPEAHLSVSCS